MNARFGTHRFASVCMAVLALTAGAALAIPRSASLQPPANYGTVTAQVVDPTPSRYTVCFTVTNTHSTYGIAGLVVYGSARPVAGSRPPHTEATLYDDASRSSAWEFDIGSCSGCGSSGNGGQRGSGQDCDRGGGGQGSNQSCDRGGSNTGRGSQQCSRVSRGANNQDCGPGGGQQGRGSQDCGPGGGNPGGSGQDCNRGGGSQGGNGQDCDHGGGQRGCELSPYCIQPGQTVGGATFCLVYCRPIDITTLSYGLHEIEACSCHDFYAHCNAPAAKIATQVVCGADNPPHPISGAAVQLVSTTSGATVATGTTDASGQYVFSGPSLAEGGYYVAAQATNFASGQGSTFTYMAAGADVSTTVTLYPAPINSLSVGALTGSVFFSDVQGYQSRQTGSTVLTEADLYSSTYASPDYTHSYLYQGTIPSFPELGSFGGPGQPQVWVIIGQPLVPETQWNNSSLTNFVAVEGGLGTGAGRARSDFSVRLLFSQPFTGPGTAFNYTISGLELTPAPSSPATWSALPAVQISGAIVPAPPAGTLPPGWMARTRFQFSEAPGVSSTAWAVGSYIDICGESFSFRIEPVMPAAP